MGDSSGRKADFYKWIKIGGLLSLLPFILVAGPLAGFYLGSYLEKRFDLPPYVSLALITVGFVGSIRETIRAIRIALRTQGKH